MTTFNIADFTVAGAYCNAMRAVGESTRNHDHHREIAAPPISAGAVFFRRVRRLVGRSANVGGSRQGPGIAA